MANKNPSNRILCIILPAHSHQLRDFIAATSSQNKGYHEKFHERCALQ
jgi:hypothetical protein